MPSKEYYWKNREKILQKNRDYSKTIKGKELARQRVARYRVRHPDRVKETNKKCDLKRKNDPQFKIKKHARDVTKRKPLNYKCELCPENDKRKAIQRHHPDYNEPLIVVSVCSQCHKWIEVG